MDIAVVVIYLLGMIAFGFWGRQRAKTESDFLVAGRRTPRRACIGAAATTPPRHPPRLPLLTLPSRAYLAPLRAPAASTSLSAARFVRPC